MIVTYCSQTIRLHNAAPPPNSRRQKDWELNQIWRSYRLLLRLLIFRLSLLGSNQILFNSLLSPSGPYIKTMYFFFRMLQRSTIATTGIHLNVAQNSEHPAAPRSKRLHYIYGSGRLMVFTELGQCTSYNSRVHSRASILTSSGRCTLKINTKSLLGFLHRAKFSQQTTCS